MTRCRLSALAQADVDAIADYSLQHWGRDQMLQYIGEMDRRIRDLAAFPETGRPAPKWASPSGR